MIIAAKQMFNAVLMYLYLVYYVERIRRSSDFMLKEALLWS